MRPVTGKGNAWGGLPMPNFEAELWKAVIAAVREADFSLSQECETAILRRIRHGLVQVQTQEQCLAAVSNMKHLVTAMVSQYQDPPHIQPFSPGIDDDGVCAAAEPLRKEFAIRHLERALRGICPLFPIC
jgi:hypothetical protein